MGLIKRGKFSWARKQKGFKSRFVVSLLTQTFFCLLLRAVKGWWENSIFMTSVNPVLLIEF